MEIFLNRAEKLAQILELKLKNPSWGPKQISKFLGINFSFVRRVLSPKELSRSNRQISKIKKLKKKHPIYVKWCAFRRHHSKEDRKKFYFHWLELYKKFGKHPKCYLLGTPIDLFNPESYSLDHIIPSSQGGDCSIENCGLISRVGNMLKSDLTLKELNKVIKKIIKNKKVWKKLIV